MRYSSLNSEPGSKMSLLNKSRLVTFCVIFAISVFVATGNSSASNVVAVIDLGKILAQSKAMKDAHQQISSLENAYKESQKNRENAFREEEQKLLQQRAILAPEAYTEKRDAFRSKARDFQNEVRAKLRQFALTRSDIVLKVETALEPIVSKIAKSVKADMILEKKQILFAATEIEITDQIISDLNKKLPKIKVKLVALPKK